MYEYNRKPGGLGAVKQGAPQVFGRGIGLSPALPPRPAPGIRPAQVNIFGGGVGVSAPAAARPVYGSAPIEQCMGGGCGTVPATADAATTPGTGRPWWQYALVGAGVVGALYMLSRQGYIRRNPEAMSQAEVIKQAAAITIQAGIPSILWGPPGIGKTQWVKGLGQAMAFMNRGEPVKVITVIGSTKDPTDIGGMPRPDGTLRPPAWAAELLERALKGQRSILFLDEFSSMSPMVHAALLRVVNEKVAGETDFDPKSGPLKGNAVHIVCAANRPKHGAGARDLPPPAANRLIHYEWPRPTAAEWMEGMLRGWRSPFYYVLPEDWRADPLYKAAFQRIGTFLKARDSGKFGAPVLFVMPEKTAKTEEGFRATGGAWPSPRSWGLASEAYAATLIAVGPDDVQGAPQPVQERAVQGAVGDEAGAQYFNFAKYKDLPDPEDLLAHPDRWTVPDDTKKLFLISMNLVNVVQNKPTAERWLAAWRALKHGLDESKDAGTLAIAARELTDMYEDPRYREVLHEASIPRKEIAQFVKPFKKMGLLEKMAPKK